MRQYESLNRLKSLFRELFQLDTADLDFGIYRFFRFKRDEIETFLDKQLPGEVDLAFEAVTGEERQQFQKRVEDLTKQVRESVADDAVLTNGEPNPKYAGIKAVKEYADSLKRLEAIEVSGDRRTEVFNQLYSFFSRYYDEGDFVPRRFFGARPAYAVPYNGEEVLFHWANRDQYYIKSGEAFRDYAFTLNTLQGEYRVRFRLIEATTPKDNTKGDTRFFFPRPQEMIFDEATRTLIVPFDYRLPTESEAARYGAKSKAQEGILAVFETRILEAVSDTLLKACLFEPSPTGTEREGEIPPTLLRRRLTHFTKKNTTDYFIHKNLGTFLQQELEFFIRDQIVHEADLEGDFEAKRRMIHVFRKLADRIIAFLAQIENAQKLLFEKKKFVLRTDYLTPVRHIPRDLWKDVLANKAQLDEWKTLYALEPKSELFNVKGKINEHVLEQHPTLVVDTRHFPPDFTARLLQNIEDLDDWADGVLVHGENFQVLNLMLARYRGQVKCTYIDPPYNTGEDGFPYKDSYQHSSWLSMVADRLQLGRELESALGTLTISIDDVELDRLCEAVRFTYGPQELAKLVWDRNRKNDARYFSVGHEYMLVVAREREALSAAKITFREPKDGIDEARELFKRLRAEHRDNWGRVSAAWLKSFDGIPVSDPRRRLIRYTKVGPRGPFRDDGNINWPGGGGPRYEILHPETKKPCRVPVSGWRYPSAERFWEEYEKGRITFGPDESTVPSVITFLFEGDGQVMPSVHYSYAQTAAQEFDALFGKRVFDNPKNWRDIGRLLRYLGDECSLTLDYFAGSGTTGHAVINLNREDGGRRKFILVEMAEYFDTVLMPRIKKVMFTPAWKEGKPKRPATKEEADRTPRLVKVLRLETYEDALHNTFADSNIERLSGKEKAYRQMVGDEEYRIRYLVKLPLEASDAMLNLARLEDPFSYTMETLSDYGPKMQYVDVVETFNCLYGLRVQRLLTWVNKDDKASKDKDGRLYRAVVGADREGKKRVLVVWRDMADIDPVKDRKFLEGKAKEIGPFEEQWVNGDSAAKDFTPLDALFRRLMTGGGG